MDGRLDRLGVWPGRPTRCHDTAGARGTFVPRSPRHYLPVVAGGIVIGAAAGGIATGGTVIGIIAGALPVAGATAAFAPITGYGFDAGAITAFAGLYWQSQRPAT